MKISKKGMTALSAIPLLVAMTGCGAGSDEDSAPEKLSVDTIYEGLSDTKVGYVAAGGTGIFNQALKDSLLSGFEKETGAEVSLQENDCGITKLAGQVKSGNVTADVWQFCHRADYNKAIEMGLLEKVDTSVVPVDLIVPSGYTDYGFDAFNFGMGILYNKADFPDEQPSTATDIFDTTTFPGKRCVLDYPQYAGVLEAAMLHSGKSPDEVYPIDMEIALGELDTIRDDLLFFSSASTAQGFQNMLNGTCSMIIEGNGSSFSFAQQNPKFDFGYTLDNAAVGSAPVGIVKGAPHPKAAQALLRWYLTDKDAQASLLNKTAYLPASLKTAPPVPGDAVDYALVGEQLDRIVKQDDQWWADHADEVTEQWNAWLAK